ncbi:hypothetical protein ACZ75_12525 [Massilia sp. NR 4-1]|nr:hypothetical protein ACZ75_12525 [Massilia sp. NR 4-1]
MARIENSHLENRMKSLPQPRKMPRQARSQHMVETILEATACVLAERGYAGTNTNVVAERAGVSVGSVYQYFPNKDSLITALHERHASQMYAVVDKVLDGAGAGGLRARLADMVRALLEAHRVEPELHKVLEKEFPFFDAPHDTSPADHSFFRRVRELLETHADEIAPRNRDLATWIVLRTLETLVHAAVIDAPAHFSTEEIEQNIVDVLAGYLMPGAPRAA